MPVLDLLTQLQDLDNRIALFVIIGLLALAAWAISRTWFRRQRG